MIVCDELLKDKSRPGKPIIVGLTSLVPWEGVVKPTALAKMTVFLVLTGGRGSALALVRCVNEESGDEVFRSGTIPISFEGRDPTGLFGAEFRMSNCRFPSIGTYLVQYLFNDTAVEERTVVVR